MIVQACGAKYSIKKELLDETDVDDVVVALVHLARSVCYISSFNMFLVSYAHYHKVSNLFLEPFVKNARWGFLY